MSLNIRKKVKLMLKILAEFTNIFSLTGKGKNLVISCILNELWGLCTSLTIYML